MQGAVAIADSISCSLELMLWHQATWVPQFFPRLTFYTRGSRVVKNGLWNLSDLNLNLNYFSPLNSCVGEGNVTPLQYSCLENPMDGGAWWAAVHGVAKSRTWLSDFTFTSLFTFMHWRRKRQPNPVFLPGESQGRQSLVGCRLWGRTELDTTEVT